MKMVENLNNVSLIMKGETVDSTPSRVDLEQYMYNKPKNLLLCLLLVGVWILD